MTLVTVVEAAGLSGVPPEHIRTLIEVGRLAAQAVPLGHGSVYLIESAEIESIVARQPDPAASPAAEASRDRLVAALAGLQAALVRRRLLAETEGGEDEPRRPRPATPLRRVSNGLPERELRALVARVDRLLGP